MASIKKEPDNVTEEGIDWLFSDINLYMPTYVVLPLQNISKRVDLA